MKKKITPPIIPLTKNAAAPQAPGTTIAQLQTEAQGRLRRIVADQTRVAEIIDVLVNEILERESRLQALTPKAEL